MASNNLMLYSLLLWSTYIILLSVIVGIGNKPVNLLDKQGHLSLWVCSSPGSEWKQWANVVEERNNTG